MYPELDALLTLADDLYNHRQHQETLTVIENIYAICDLYQFDCDDLQERQIIANHDNPKDYNFSSHSVGS